MVMCKSLKRLSNMETWLSGRKRLTANEVARKKAPGFESLRLRKNYENFGFNNRT